MSRKTMLAQLQTALPHLIFEVEQGREVFMDRFLVYMEHSLVHCRLELVSMYKEIITITRTKKDGKRDRRKHTKPKSAIQNLRELFANAPTTADVQEIGK